MKSEIGLNKELDSGIFITSVNKNSPASKAGLEEGDIILQIDDIMIDKMSELRTYIYSKKVGDNVRIKYLRDNKEYEVEIKLAKK